MRFIGLLFLLVAFGALASPEWPRPELLGAARLPVRPRLHLASSPAWLDANARGCGATLSVCATAGCAPAMEGLLLRAWPAAWAGRPPLNTSGELAWALPNDASRPLLNAREAAGRLLLARRGGGAALATKARHAQAAGAVALLVADDGSCGEALDCGPRVGSCALGEALAERDGAEAWRGVRIAVAMLSQGDARRLAAAAAPLLRSVATAGDGEQEVLA